MTNTEFKRLVEIDDKMLEGKEITEEERLERLIIIEKYQKTTIEDDGCDYLKDCERTGY